MLDGTYKRWPADFKVAPTGRIKCGTESNGGFKNITISNCVLDGCRGFALESVDGALFEDITFTGVTMRDCTNTPLFLRLGSRMRGPAGVPVGTLKRMIISNVVSYNSASQFSGAGLIMGIPSQSHRRHQNQRSVYGTSRRRNTRNGIPGRATNGAGIS